jgi:hypothetical protein
MCPENDKGNKCVLDKREINLSSLIYLVGLPVATPQVTQILWK